MKLTFSSVMRLLRQKNKNIISEFLIQFKKNMFAAIEENIESPEQTALLQTMQDLKLKI